MSKPFLKLDEKLIEELAGLACTVEDIARICKCSKDTLERRYMENLELGRANTRMSIRREQYTVAMDKEHKSQATMLIWLGKILCEQSEVQAFLSKLSDETLAGELRRRIEDGKLTPGAV